LATTEEATRASGPIEGGRAPALAEVFREHARFVMRVLRRMGVFPSDVEDATQEVFLVVQQRLSTYDPRRPIQPWLFGITSRVALRLRRRAETADAANKAQQREPAREPTHDPLRVLEGSEARRMLARALDTLDDPRREVFVAFDLEGMPMAQIAEMQGCPLQTAYARLHSARRLVLDFAARQHALEAAHG
jgi:RNA polymerase sigma-70 factor (ECF subfamily)